MLHETYNLCLPNLKSEMVHRVRLAEDELAALIWVVDKLRQAVSKPQEHVLSNLCAQDQNRQIEL